MRNISSLLISISVSRDRSFRSTPKIGHDLPKQPVTMDRNHWSRLTEMTGHDAPKYACWRALREIVINMFVHRDYRSANDSTIKIFDDRIEFFNPGTLLDDLTVDMIKTGNYKSHLRNKQIATIFKELELIEKYGSGVRRTIETFVAYGLPEPVYEATQGGMAVTVFKKITESENKEPSGGVNGLLTYIQSHPGQRAGEMAVAFKLTKRIIERWLKQLKETNEVEFLGAPKTGGYFSTTKASSSK